MKHVKNCLISLFKINFLLLNISTIIFSLDAKGTPGTVNNDMVDIDSNVHYYIVDNNEATIVTCMSQKFQNPPLAWNEDPREIDELIESGEEIIMVPLAGLPLVLSNKFNKMTLIAPDLYEVGMHRHIYKHHPFTSIEGKEFLESLINDFIIDDEMDESYVKQYFEIFYNKFNEKNNNTEICSQIADIFKQESLSNKTIFISHLFEQEQENRQKNLEVIKKWLENNNTVIMTITCPTAYEIIQTLELINIKNFVSKKHISTIYLSIKKY